MTTETALVPVDANALLVKAIEHNVSIETLERLVALREKLHAEAARTAFFDALAAFQGNCPVVVKDKLVTITPREGRAYSYHYAPLDRIVSQVAGLLEAHGFSYTLNTRQEDAQLTVICTVHHRAGHSESSEFTVPIDRTARMNDTQKVGAARTFCMRYAFCNAVGIMTGDEDNDTVEQEAKDKFKKLAPAAGPSSPAAPSQVADPTPLPAAVSSLPPGKKRSLEAAIQEYAEAWGIAPTQYREAVKRKMAEDLGVEHFTDLDPAQYEQVMRWINAAWTKRKEQA